MNNTTENKKEFNTTALLNAVNGFENTKTINWNGIQLNVKRYISLAEMLEFVDYVTKMCFGDNNEYRPELKDMAIKICTLEKFAGVVLPEDVSKTYDIIYGTDIVRVVYDAIDPEQIAEIVHAIDVKVANTARANIERVNAELDKINKRFEDIQASIEKVFSNVSPEDITAMLKSIPDIANIDEGDFIQKYIENTKAADA